jgi:hypothetical protein
MQPCSRLPRSVAAGGREHTRSRPPPIPIIRSQTPASPFALSPPRPPCRTPAPRADQVQALIGAKNAVAMDLTAACSGFVLALVTAAQYVRTGACKHCLVVGGDALSRITDWRDRGARGGGWAVSDRLGGWDLLLPCSWNSETATDTSSNSHPPPPPPQPPSQSQTQVPASCLATAAAPWSSPPPPTARPAPCWAWTCTAMATGRRASTPSTAAVAASPCRCVGCHSRVGWAAATTQPLRASASLPRPAARRAADAWSTQDQQTTTTGQPSRSTTRANAPPPS